MEAAAEIAAAARAMAAKDESEIVASRRAGLGRLRERGWAYPNDFRRKHLAARLHERFGDAAPADLERDAPRAQVAGRMVSRRVMGRASFAHLQDMSGRLQLHLRRDRLGDGGYADFRSWDLGDILGAAGTLFKTRTGELSLLADDVRLLSKSLRPLPEKYHGLADRESRYRQRYLDLIANEDARRVFECRARTVRFLRDFLRRRGFVEVETPMMQLLPGGAAARPFVTHHNALGLDLYLRVAPELYLKRLLIGGMEQVFELNRNFRNEGLSTRHNPEFTMLEFYQAYADCEDFMALIETLLRGLARQFHGSPPVLRHGGGEIDLGPRFARTTLRQAVLDHNPELAPEILDSLESIRAVAADKNIAVAPGDSPAEIECALFEKTVEHRLRAPTFVTAYPLEVSPLARALPGAPERADRFELFVAGQEVANGFSELNDPEEQARRFRRQAGRRNAGDEEAMRYDEDFVTAMEYGMPPAAGAGIGIDRLVMVLAGAASIREVILFPLLRDRP